MSMGAATQAIPSLADQLASSKIIRPTPAECEPVNNLAALTAVSHGHDYCKSWKRRAARVEKYGASFFMINSCSSLSLPLLAALSRHADGPRLCLLVGLDRKRAARSKHGTRMARSGHATRRCGGGLRLPWRSHADVTGAIALPERRCAHAALSGVNG